MHHLTTSRPLKLDEQLTQCDVANNRTQTQCQFLYKSLLSLSVILIIGINSG